VNPTLHSAIRRLCRLEADAAERTGDTEAARYYGELADQARQHVTPESELAAMLWLTSWSPTLSAAESEAA
jgi:hypothetical protein